MSQQRISDSLKAFFSSHSVVFWHDVDAEFSTTAGDLAIDGVRLVLLDETPALRIKLDMAREPRQRWLLYSTQPEPQPAKDWLLDVRLRSKSFRADSTSILLEDLGLTTLSLRKHLKDRNKFLRVKERVDRLKRVVLPGDSAQDLDRKMLAVLTRADSPELFVVLQRLFAGFVIGGVADLAAQPKAWQDVGANDLLPAFWELVQLQLGYTDPNPTLRDLLVRILVTDFCRSLVDDAPRQLAHFVLPERALAANASVLAARWRSDIAQFDSYNALAQAVAQELELNSLLAGQSAEQLAECMTFEEVELRVVLARSVVVSLRDGEAMISDEQSLTFDSTSQLLDERKRSVYLTVQSGTHDPHKRYDLVMRDATTKVEVLRLPIKVDLAFGNDF